MASAVDEQLRALVRNLVRLPAEERAELQRRWGEPAVVTLMQLSDRFVNEAPARSAPPPPASTGSATAADASVPSALRVHTFGHLRIIHHGTELPLGRSHARHRLELLTCLIEAAPEPAALATLGRQLYGPNGTDPGDCTDRLLSLLCGLRHMLGNAAAIVRSQNSLALDPHRLWIDAVELEALVRAGADNEALREWARRNVHGPYLAEVAQGRAARSRVIEYARNRYAALLADSRLVQP